MASADGWAMSPPVGDAGAVYRSNAVLMVEPGGVEDEPKAVYDIQMGQSPPESLRQQYPSMTVAATGARTVLRRDVDGPGQLTSLLRDLSAVGLVLTDIHLLTPADPSAGEADAGPQTHGTQSGQNAVRSATYEVRVAGALGDPLLRSLRCSHYAVPERTLVRVAVADAELGRFLRACANCGIAIDGVRRVGAAPAGT